MPPNPLFPTNDAGQQPAEQPVTAGRDPAVDMIRQKISALYAEEPDASVEASEAETATVTGSKHQAYMRSLTESGKNTVEIQAAWHAYYVSLPDTEKYEVWQEFYSQSGPSKLAQPNDEPVTQPRVIPADPAPQALPVVAQTRERQKRRSSLALSRAAARVKSAAGSETAADAKRRLLHSVRSAVSGSGRAKTPRRKLAAKHHIQSLAFGLGIGSLVVFGFLFSFFNQIIIAPLIQPSRTVTNTPVIVDVASTVVSGDPKIIIPKINVEIPVDYSQTTTKESDIELALDKGVVHYPTTVRPGQAGNAAFFGHSSNNIFNPGKYKFAFVLLHTLQEGDTFYLSDGGKTYAYKVFSKRVVSPTEVGVLKGVEGHAATATLITCDPPGTSINRLVVVGDQISPDSDGNTVPETKPVVETAVTTEDNSLPGNGPSLWSRMWASVF